MSDVAPEPGHELPPEEAPPVMRADTSPEPAKPRRSRSRKKPGEAEPAPPKATTARERPPRTRSRAATPAAAKRESLAEAAATIYGGVGKALESSGAPQLIPGGRAMQFVAPVAGAAIDDVIAGTSLDKRLQPLAHKGEKLERLADVALFPLLMLAIGNQPQLYPLLAPVARSFMERNIVAMAAEVTKKRQRDADVAKVMGELVAEGILPAAPDGGVPSLDELMTAMFTPPDGWAPPEPEPAAEPAATPA